MPHGDSPRVRIDLDYYGWHLEDLLLHILMHISEMERFCISESEELKFFLKFPVRIDQISLKQRLQSLGLDIAVISEAVVMELDFDKHKTSSKL